MSAMGFCGWGGGRGQPSVSVLVSNNVQKYRVQSDGLEWCWLLVAELERRLARELGGNGHLGFGGTLPLPDYFLLLDHHFEVGRKAAQLEEMLGQRCAQLRAVEKQLLSRFRDTTPAPLAHLDGLVEMSYGEVMKIADSLEELEGRVRVAEAALDAVSRLITALLRLSTQLDPKLPTLLSAALLLIPGQRDGVCWEQRAEAGLAHILRLVAVDAAATSHVPPPRGPFSDTARLKKSLTGLVERVSEASWTQFCEAPPPILSNAPEPTSHSKRFLRAPLGCLEGNAAGERGGGCGAAVASGAGSATAASAHHSGGLQRGGADGGGSGRRLPPTHWRHFRRRPRTPQGGKSQGRFASGFLCQGLLL